MAWILEVVVVKIYFLCAVDALKSIGQEGPSGAEEKKVSTPPTSGMAGRV